MAPLYFAMLALQGISKIMEGQAQAQAYEQQAENAQIAAERAREAADNEVRRVRREGVQSLGSATSAMGASGGIIDGSMLDMLRSAEMDIEEDIRITRLQGEREAEDYLNQVDYYQQAARASRMSGLLAGMTGGLGGFAAGKEQGII